jgi:hypothetical protein
MGLFDYLRRRRERESPLSAEQLAAVDPPATEPEPEPSHESIAAAMKDAGSGGLPSVPGAVQDAFRYAAATGSPGVAVEGLDHAKLRQLQSSVLAIMKEHGIDPMRPDPSRFTDPEVQRALQDAVLKHGLLDGR